MKLQGQQGQNKLVLTRREAINRSAKALAGLSLSGALACNWPQGQRSFFIRNVFKWTPADVAKDVAFALIPATGFASMDYLDAHCRYCRAGFRVFLHGASLARRLAVKCPACPPQLRLAVIASKALVSELRNHAIKRAVALAARGGYQIHRVGPAGPIAVTRSAACYDVSNREPRNRFEREIPAVPARIFYFTEVAGVRGHRKIFHSWRRDGKLTDRIPLDVRSSRWRTWTYKKNLAPGAWILTAETTGGEVLDVREFHIA